MNNLYDELPIIACSSGTSTNVAISVIRISGINAFSNVSHFFSINSKSIEPRRAYFSKLLDLNGSILDEVVFTYFEAPHSYNGESILEISVHGNKINIQRILKVFIDSGLVRHSEPGEFTLRALKNGKLNLSQVEGLDLLLNASSDFALDQGMNILNGELFDSFNALHDKFIKLKASLELGIDFSDDVGEEQFLLELKNNFSDFFKLITSLHKRTSSNSGNLVHPSIAVFGPTNSGKSSLFNVLLGEERAIVSDIEGTTRDYLSEYVNLNNIEFRLIDTAGIRQSNDLIEIEGIKRSQKIIDNAFYKILLLDMTKDNSAFLAENSENAYDLVLYTHSDSSQLDEFLNDYKPAINDVTTYYCSLISESGPIGPIHINSGPIGPDALKTGPIEPNFSKTGPIGPLDDQGGSIEPLEKTFNSSGLGVFSLIEEQVLLKYGRVTACNPILIDRHKAKIEEIYEKSVQFHVVMGSELDLGILASELNLLNNSVIELLGIITPDAVLSSIFANFCIGK